MLLLARTPSEVQPSSCYCEIVIATDKSSLGKLQYI